MTAIPRKDLEITAANEPRLRLVEHPTVGSRDIKLALVKTDIAKQLESEITVDEIVRPKSQRKQPVRTRSTMNPKVERWDYKINPAWVLDYVNPTTKKPTHKTLGKVSDLSEFQACLKAHQYLDAIADDVDPFAGDLTVEQYFDERRLPWAKLKLRSWRDLKGVFDRYIRLKIGHRKMRDVNRRELQALMDAFEVGVVPTARCERLSHSTRNHIGACLKGLFSHAFKAGDIPTNPAAGIKLQRPNNERQEVFTAEQLACIFLLLKAENPLVLLLFVLLLATAARISELLNARHADVDEVAGTIFLKQTKSGRSFRLVLSEPALAAYAELKALAVPGNPYLFPGKRVGQPMTPPRKAFQRVLAAAGITNRTFHDARRTAITLAVQSPGVTLTDASRMANHANSRITEARYVVVGDSRIRNAVNEIGKRLPLHLGLRCTDSAGGAN
jgi:integrase